MSDKFQQDANSLADFLDSFGRSTDGRTNITIDSKNTNGLFGITPENKKILAKYIRSAKKIFSDDTIAKLKKLSESYDVIYEDCDGSKTLFLGFDNDRYRKWQKRYGKISGSKHTLQYANKNMVADVRQDELPETDLLIWQCKCYSEYRTYDDYEPCSCEYVNLPGSFVGSQIGVINSSYYMCCFDDSVLLTKDEYQKYLKVPPKFLKDNLFIAEWPNIDYHKYFESTQQYRAKIDGEICTITLCKYPNFNTDGLVLTDKLLEEMNPMITEYQYIIPGKSHYRNQSYPEKMLLEIHNKFRKPVVVKKASVIGIVRRIQRLPLFDDEVATCPPDIW